MTGTHYQYEHRGSSLRECSESFAFLLAIIFGLAGLAISIWLGIALLVPDTPFTHREIAGGIVLIVFCWLSAIISAIIGGLLGWLIGVPFDCCCDGCPC
jgi:hypothetical protein